jgi:hypothetical protein
VNHVGVRAHSMVWNKENLINLGIARLPEDWKYVAWIDADVMFRRADWAAETVHALQLHQVVQPWAHCYDLGPNGEHLQTHTSFLKQWVERKPIVSAGGAGYEVAHPGYAWAATRGALTAVGGLIDTAGLGAGDHHMALALIGRADESLPGNVTGGYRRPIMAWQERAVRHVNRSLGFVSGTIEHAWHGPKVSRDYIGRWQIVTRNGFDPDTDIKRNTWGVMELAGNKPELARDVWAYFNARNEDATTL